jgi:peptide chain release factor subunit 1
MDQIELDVERTIVDEFLQEVMKSNPKATYGEIMIRSALGQGAVATLLLSEAITKRRVRWFCKECKNEWETTHEKSSVNPTCPECKSSKVNEDKENSMELIDELTILAGHTSAKVRLISLDTEEGSTLYTAFGGITALLRYPIS